MSGRTAAVPEWEKDEIRRQELAAIAMPPFPSINQILQWKAELIQNVAIASGRVNSDPVAAWIGKAMDDDVTVDALADVDDMRFGTLDLKLGSAMMQMLEKAGEKARQLRENVQHQRLQSTKNKKIFRGRQIVKMFLQSFKTFDQSEVMYDLVHLFELQIKNGDLHGFLVSWHHLLDNQVEAPLIRSNPKILRDPLYKKLKDHPSLTRDIADYERMTEADPKKTYDFLITAATNAVARERSAQNMADREAVMRQGNVYMAAAPATGGFKTVETRKQSQARKAAERAGSNPPASDGKAKGGKGQGGRSQSQGAKGDGPPKAPEGVCREFWKSGTCPRGAECKYEHKKMPEHCYYHHHEPPCRFGDGCKFLHVNIPSDVKARLQKPPSRSSSQQPNGKGRGRGKGKGSKDNVCWAFRDGKCERGDACRFSRDKSAGAGGKGGRSTPGKGSQTQTPALLQQAADRLRQQANAPNSGQATAAPAVAHSGVMPPITFGVLCVCHVALPGSTRSGE